MKVKIISDKYTSRLEISVNEALSRLEHCDIIDIKYQGIGNSPAYSTDRPSAMLILTDEGYEKIRYLW